MTRGEDRRVGEDPREVSGAAGERVREVVPKDAEKDDVGTWTDAGTEDPAFFIKPSDGE